MTRTVIAAALLMELVSCQGEEGAPEPRPTVLGGEEARVSTPDLSPDGTRIAYATTVAGAGAIFVANADGSDPVRVTHGVFDRNPRWSPDGRSIAFVAESPDYDVFVVPAEGGEPRQLTSGPGIDMTGGWLPDGSAVLVYRQLGGTTRTLAVPVDGGAEHELGSSMEGNQWVAVSPDGTRLAYDLHPRGGEGTIWVQDLPGGTPRQITSEGLETALPTSKMWSPDGRSIAYLSRRTGTWDIWVADVETGATRQLTSDIHNDTNHTWSPDGRWMAFLSDRGGQTDVWIMPSSGGAAKRVTDDLAVESSLAWSPDGQTLFYVSLDGESRLQLIPTDGGSPRTLVDWPGYQMEGGTVSPDGNTVLFASNRSGSRDIWSVPTQGGEAVPFVVSPRADFAPHFSPEGSRVSFLSDRGGSNDLWVVPAEGGEPRQLLDWPSDETWAVWSPDGANLAFLSNRDATSYDLWVVPGAGGEARRITTGAGVRGRPAWAPDGSALYYVGATAAGTADLYRVPAAGGSPESLGGDPHLDYGSLSPDGAYYAYPTFIQGWAFVDVIPTAGGSPRRMTVRTERVYQSDVRWSPDGTALAVLDYDLASDWDDLTMLSWPEGDWSPLTQTPDLEESLQGFTPDGTAVLSTTSSVKSRLMSVSVAELVAPVP